MILIADSGSTKTKWVVIDGKEIIHSFETRGLNPYFQTIEETEQRIKIEILPHLQNIKINALHFYGAGCTPEKKDTVKQLFSNHFTATQTIIIESDMVGAARGLCGNEAGIVCILGTGSNSCFYNGKDIIKNISPLGYILGDEGSGAVLGRTLVGDLLKNQLPKGLKEKFLNRYSLTPADIIESIYRKPFANRFLAGLSPFLLENIEIPEIRELVLGSFVSFIERNVKQYDYHNHPVCFVGSIAYYYKSILIEAAHLSGITVKSIEKDPVNGLIQYHSLVNSLT
jgi:Predicted N-acetylglucosamine kinase